MLKEPWRTGAPSPDRLQDRWLEAGVASNVVAGGIGEVTDPGHVDADQLSIPLQRLPGDEHRVDVRGVHAPYHRPNRVVDGEDVGSVGAEHDHVCLLARRERPG